MMNVTSNWRGAPLHLELAAGTLHWKMDYEYDALGQVAAVSMPGSLRTVFGYDAAGRRALTVLPDGSGIRDEHDTEDRIVRTTRLLDALAGGGTGLSALRFTYDHAEDKPGKLAEVGDTAGLIKRYGYDELGRLATARSALGITTAFAYDAAGLLASRTDAAGSPDAANVGLTYDTAGHATEITAGNGVKTVRRYDDFGRKVMEADPDHGITIFRHDPAGHVVARIDESLVATRFTYDHAGRLVAMGADKEPNLVQYRYRGRQLQGVVSTPDSKPEHATERTDYERDAFGRVTRETRWLANVAPRAGAAPGFSFVTTSEYDDAGRLIAQTLPDGHRLQYRYARADAGATNRHRPGQLEAILFDDDVVVTDIEQTIAGGLTGYTMGNGARQRITLDSRGRIEKLQVLAGQATGLTGWWRRIMAWFSGGKGDGDALLYRQVNRYDADGRIRRIDRQMPSAEPGRGQIARSETYAYDQMNRLTGIQSNDGTETRYAYDKGGNRMLEAVGSTRDGGQSAAPSDPAPGQIVKRYAYAPGTNRLIAITSGKPGIDNGTAAAPRNAAEAARLIRDAWFYHPTGVPLAQLVWTNRGDRADRRIVYNSDKRPIAVYINEQLVARYHYNVQGERIAKTLYAKRRPLTAVGYRQGDDAGVTSYSLYRGQRLAAETDGAGRITAHYVYLYGKPVAKIVMEGKTLNLHRLWENITTRTDAYASEKAAHIYAIVTDHLGMPQQVIDEHQRLLWRAYTTAFGQARITYATTASQGAKPFVMNLRLPGQVYDKETNLQYNYLRDYDPALGRYLTPDPMAQGNLVSPYAYVSDNPLTNIDQLGLYQIDVHYYMTYFLAITSGVDRDKARLIALATQYIDENRATSPTPNGVAASSMAINQPALDRYHFVEYGYDTPRTLAQSLYEFTFSRDSDDYIANRIKDPASPQLARLLAASDFAKTDPNATCNSSAQLFGEYLHAFEDTFAHRDQNNEPYSAETAGYGTGHLFGGENPDYTYNHFSGFPGIGLWDNNETRTLEMESEVFNKLSSLTTNSGTSKKFKEIESILRQFNSSHASDKDIDNGKFAGKIAILNDGLKTLGYRGIDMSYGSLTEGFNVGIAAINRKDALGKLNPQDYVGTILPKGMAPLPTKK